MAWWRSSRMDRIEQNMERMQQSIQELAEISVATNRRIDRFVETLDSQIQEQRAETAQLKRAVDYLMSKDG